MCGIFGFIAHRRIGMQKPEWETVLHNLFRLAETRGKEAAGLAIATSERIGIHKDSTSASAMLKTHDYAAFLERQSRAFFSGQEGDVLAAIGHSRLVTNGLQGIDANNQPVWRKECVLVHNGIVVNVDDLWEAYDDITPTADVDTEIIAVLVSKFRQAGADPLAAVAKTFSMVYGETSIALFLSDLKMLVLATNTGSLYVGEHPTHQGMLFTSEEYQTQQLISGKYATAGFEDVAVRHIQAGQGVAISLDDLSMTEFALDASLPTPHICPMLATQRRIEEKVERARQAMQDMQRCRTCLLPETMPYIVFDQDGICNYCHTYKPYTLRGDAELEDLLNTYRKQDGSADCLVAFSGGRDSSYGLHLLRERYHMTPIAFTYDWGMVTDLARRNQARICGKLGIEHLWVSADIKKKRENIRRNVLAWLKKPDLGIIPLFMAGDKHVLWHANRIMRDTQIPVMVFCGNHFEKTEFKTGFLGVQSKQAIIHKPASLSLAGKIGMLTKYGARFLANPRYLNRSLPDTLTSFFSYYAIEQDYLSLFDFIQWDETEIEQTLIPEYDWELAADTHSSWRIGDGTAPFYNYIYYTVAGFTEYDTFRSAQIREHILTREEALQRVEEENRPRWDSIREYTQLINIDFDETMRVIDRIPKLYIKTIRHRFREGQILLIAHERIWS